MHPSTLTCPICGVKPHYVILPSQRTRVTLPTTLSPLECKQAVVLLSFDLLEALILSSESLPERDEVFYLPLSLSSLPSGVAGHLGSTIHTTTTATAVLSAVRSSSP
ncbi:unnamed protein product [Pleuronectes platessa]|uniref:Uncharacterized protein n=1 Tax=Pleuronectes platessa TaxID=8262 RepID=A0A9N7TXD9_PLEPL|nr:unnamed protein product [Pleuronectes platessa]